MFFDSLKIRLKTIVKYGIREFDRWFCIGKFGSVAEWINALVLKTSGPSGPVGSNPTASAKYSYLVVESKSGRTVAAGFCLNGQF